jgi:hypothetical protein
MHAANKDRLPGNGCQCTFTAISIALIGAAIIAFRIFLGNSGVLSSRRFPQRKKDMRGSIFWVSLCFYRVGLWVLPCPVHI